MTLEGYKVVSAKAMADMEKLSIDEGANAQQYMQTAGLGISKIVENYCLLFKLQKKVILLVGKGNNGGDAYASGCDLLKKGFQVTAYQLFPLDESSDLCKANGKEFLSGGGEMLFPTTLDALHLFSDGVIIDGIFGTGLTGEVSGFIKEVIEHANTHNMHLLSIDIPSGLNGDTGEVKSVAIKARATMYLGLPKLGFFIRDGINHIGSPQHCDFGMDVEYIHQITPSFHLVSEKAVPKLLPKPKHNQNKYDAGYVLAIAGSPGMTGAAMLACSGALRSGAGMVRLFYSEAMKNEISNEFYELLKSPRLEATILKEAKRAKSALIGPGLGRGKETAMFIRSIAPKLTVPTVLDADGLILLRDELKTLKQDVIITPHKGEMAALLDLEKFPEDNFMQICQRFAEINNVTLVLKGAPTFIFEKGTSPIAINKGDPGMASAGMGDVLTGMIAAFLAAGLKAREAATLAVYLHGFAGELGSSMLTSYHMIATDLIKALPTAITQLLKQSAY